MNTVLFDLDGTLLPMDLDEFVETYIKALSFKMKEKGYDADKVVKALWVGFEAMYANDGFITNEECFWKAFESVLYPKEKKMPPKEKMALQRTLEKFYKKEYEVARFVTKPTHLAKECIEILKSKGYQVIIATNPVFPEVATLQRLSWAGIDEDDYILVTTYENSCYTKPNLNYYRKILQIIDKDPEDCMMVGNDVHEDMCAFKIGMDVFLINECLINKYEEDISDYKVGDWNFFKEFVSDLPTLI